MQYQIFYRNRPTLWFGDLESVQDYAQDVMVEIVNEMADEAFREDSDWTGAYWDQEVQEWFANPAGQYEPNVRYGIRDNFFVIRQIEGDSNVQ